MVSIKNQSNKGQVRPYDKNDVFWKSNTKKVVLVGGCFDVLHYGHVKFLQSAKAKGELLVVALEPDEFIASRKKRKPVHTQAERAAILSALRSVDIVLLLPLFTTDSQYKEMVALIRPKIVATTAGDPHLLQKKASAAKVGAQVLEVTELINNLSTTTLLKYEGFYND